MLRGTYSSDYIQCFVPDAPHILVVVVQLLPIQTTSVSIVDAPQLKQEQPLVASPAALSELRRLRGLEQSSDVLLPPFLSSARLSAGVDELSPTPSYLD